VHIFGFYLPYIYIYGFILAVALVIGCTPCCNLDQVRAQRPGHHAGRDAARLVGIDVNRVAAVTFRHRRRVTAAGGMVYGATNAFNPNNAYDLISRLLAIIILGGLGSIGGRARAAVFMITLESVVTIWYPTWAVVVFYGALILVLVIRPKRLLRQKAVRAQ